MNFKNRFTYLLVLFLLLEFGHPQNSTTQVQLNAIYTFNLKAKEQKYLSVTIQDVDAETNLYVVAESPFNDPYEEPYLTIQSSRNYLQQCFEEDNEYTGICEIPNSELQKGRVFTVVLQCIVDCRFDFSAYLSDLVQVDFGEQVQLTAYQDFGVAQTLKIKVPQTLNFTDIYIVATIQNQDYVFEGVQMYANWGSNINNPTPTENQAIGQTAWGQSKGIFLSKDEVSAGDEIRTHLVLGVNVSVNFFVSSINGNTRKITLNSDILDFTADGDQKLYILDLTQYNQTQLKQYDLNILFLIYSGLTEVFVSFDSQFSENKVIDNYYISSTINYLISPALRQQKGFNGTIYIKVTSLSSSNYFLMTGVNRKNFVDLDNQITQLVEIQKDDIQNFIYEDFNEDNGQESQIISYKTEIQMLEGGMLFANRICYSLQQNNTLDCIINNKTFLKDEKVKQTFEEITANVTHYYNTYDIFWNYDVTKCPKITLKNKVGFLCEYQIVVMSVLKDKDTYTAITNYKRKIYKKLREGVIVRDFLFREQYQYYQFTLSDVTNIKQINIFVTVIDGDVGMLFSQKQKYPDMLNVGDDVKLSVMDSIILVQDQIKAGKYYIAVYSYEISQYTISVAIQRGSKDNNATNMTQIQLKNGVTQKYTMNKGKQQMDFFFRANSDMSAKLMISQLQGQVNYEIHNKKKQERVQCNSLQKCQFDIDSNTSYLIKVKGKKDKLQTFLITLSQQDRCLRYPINYPVFVVLQNSTSCYKYNVPQEQDLQITVSMTALDFLQQQVNIFAVFPKETKTLTSNQLIISQEEIQTLCEKDAQQEIQQTTCTFELRFQSSRNVVLQAAVQQTDSENVLFSGIVQKVQTNEISIENPKEYYYFIFSKKDINIILTSKSHSQYQIIAKIVSNSEFMKGQEYPKLNENGTYIQSINSTQDNPLTILTLHKKMVKSKNCDLCLLLISVYGLSQDDQYSYTIEALQQQRKLNFGQSKIGYLGKGQIHQYQIKTYADKNSLLTVTPFEEEKCFKAYIEDPTGHPEPFLQYKSFSGQTNTYTVIVQAAREKCPYHISYSSTDLPVIDAWTQVPYSVKIQNMQQKYFLHYHAQNKSFRVIELVSSGDAKVAATPVGNMTVQKLMQKNIENFEFYEKNTINDMLINKENSAFCYNCYYFIVVKGDPSVKEDLVIISDDNPIPLKDGTNFKDKVKASEKKEYELYSTSTFILNMNILYGNVTINVFDPKDRIVVNQTLTLSKQYTIGKPSSTDGQSPDYFNPNSMYTIRIQGVQASGYSIRTHKKQKGTKISQGIPINIRLQPKQQQLIVFENLMNNGTLNIMVQNLNYEAVKSSLKFSASVISPDNIVTPNVIKNKGQSEGSYNIELQAIKGKYQFSIISTKKIDVSIIYAKKSLTHLKVGNTVLVKNEGIFQIFSPQQSIIIEVYDCKGEVAVQASQNYYDLQSENPNNILMEHSNYGGHYVITTSKLQGQYFVKTNNNGYDGETSKQFMFLITYYLYSSINPYKQYHIGDTQIAYKNNKQTIQFVLDGVYEKQRAQPYYEIRYLLYISKQAAPIDQMVSCSLGSVYTITKTVKNSQAKQKVTFQFKKQQIWEIVGEDADSYQVGGQAKVILSEARPQYISELNFAYDKVHVTKSSEPVYKDNDNLRFVLLFIVIPFLVACFLLYMAARYCFENMKKQPNQLIQEDDFGPSQEQFKNADNPPVQYSLQ